MISYKIFVSINFKVVYNFTYMLERLKKKKEGIIIVKFDLYNFKDSNLN